MGESERAAGGARPCIGLPRKRGVASLFCFSIVEGTGYEPEILRVQLEKGLGESSRATGRSCSAATTWSSAALATRPCWASGARRRDPRPRCSSRPRRWASPRRRDCSQHAALLERLGRGADEHPVLAVRLDGEGRPGRRLVARAPGPAFVPLDGPQRVREELQQVSRLWRLPDDVRLHGDLLARGPADVLQRRGSLQGQAALDWGEDLYMGKCLNLLGVEALDDFEVVSDGVCSGVDCGDDRASAFHPFKSKEIPTAGSSAGGRRASGPPRRARAWRPFPRLPRQRAGGLLLRPREAARGPAWLWRCYLFCAVQHGELAFRSDSAL
ncbi:unnamed protein product [Prorocentrum cordatum]|uniref:Uncharacterized protein n=1 Tax=Prorocentrum cordatum TaxID=2364126 RepID=A0ABN9TY90_9DINO|nr:unnamed protein product [Polarella glacialis]